MRALLLLQASREARRRVTGELSKVSRPATVDAQRRSFAAAPVKADAATPKQREVREEGGKGEWREVGVRWDKCLRGG